MTMTLTTTPATQAEQARRLIGHLSERGTPCHEHLANALWALHNLARKGDTDSLTGLVGMILWAQEWDGEEVDDILRRLMALPTPVLVDALNVAAVESGEQVEEWLARLPGATRGGD